MLWPSHSRVQRVNVKSLRGEGVVDAVAVVVVVVVEWFIILKEQLLLEELTNTPPRYLFGVPRSPPNVTPVPWS